MRLHLYTVASWKDGVAQAEVKPAKLSFRFEEVDTDGGTASVVGPFGASDIVVRVSMDTLHFVQSFRDGPLYVTTVIGRPAGAGRWLAVHTRHEYTDVSLPGYTSTARAVLRLVLARTIGELTLAPLSVLRSTFYVRRSTFGVRAVRAKNLERRTCERRTQNEERSPSEARPLRCERGRVRRDRQDVVVGQLG